MREWVEPGWKTPEENLTDLKMTEAEYVLVNQFQNYI